MSKTDAKAPRHTEERIVRRVHPWRLSMCAPSSKAKNCLNEIAKYHKQNPKAKRRVSKYLKPNNTLHGSSEAKGDQ